MKKSITLLFILNFILAFSQDYPGEEVELLLNKQVRVKPKSKSFQDNGYLGFYINRGLVTKYACCNKYGASIYDSLANKEFKITEIREYNDILNYPKFGLKLENPETGIIYFDYDPENDQIYPFEVLSDLNLPLNYYCKQIEIEQDNFENSTIIRTPIKSGVKLIKQINNKKEVVYLSIEIPGSTLTIGEKGLFLKFNDSVKILFPEAEINVDVRGSNYLYNVFVRLSKNQLETFRNNLLTDVRLYIYDKKIDNENAKMIQNYTQCLNDFK